MRSHGIQCFESKYDGTGISFTIHISDKRWGIINIELYTFVFDTLIDGHQYFGKRNIMLTTLRSDFSFFIGKSIAVIETKRCNTVFSSKRDSRLVGHLRGACSQVSTRRLGDSVLGAGCLCDLVFEGGMVGEISDTRAGFGRDVCTF